MKIYIPLLTFIALLFTALPANAQTSVPTPQSVAPNFVMPSSQFSQFRMPARAYTWDIYPLLQYQFSFDNTLRNQTFQAGANPANRVTGDVSMKFNRTVNFGIGIAYNITDQLAVLGEFAYGRPSYDGTFVNRDVPGDIRHLSGTADITTGDFGLQYNFLPGKFTPFIAGTLGYYFVDTGIATGDTNLICWWDYWWGYSCSRTAATATKTWFTLGIVAGVRYNVADNFYMAFSYGGRWLDTEHSMPFTSRLSLSAIWNF